MSQILALYAINQERELPAESSKSVLLDRNLTQVKQTTQDENTNYNLPRAREKQGVEAERERERGGRFAEDDGGGGGGGGKSRDVRAKRDTGGREEGGRVQDGAIRSHGSVYISHHRYT